MKILQVSALKSQGDSDAIYLLKEQVGSGLLGTCTFERKREDFGWKMHL